MILQIPLRIYRGHAAAAGGGNRLAVNMVLNIAALVSWGIACFEYLLQVPANRLGHTQMSLPQLKIMQEVITLSVFAPFAVFCMNEPLKWDYLWAGVCLLGAVYFVFRS